VQKLQKARTKAHVHNTLGLGNNLVLAAFFKIDGTIRPRRGRTW